MAVTLAKTPQLHFFLAVVSNQGTDSAHVHALLLTRQNGYANQVDLMHLQARAVNGGELVCIVAGDRSAAYADARQGECNEELMTAWIDQQITAHGL
ncbi:hypothetical protein ACGFR8_31695 [Streptomyces brevispora]|uniref:hypothetical protein n=1 Tax=Streptomyces brevispora TaxID=887462 RepID=UPI003717B96D